MYNRIILEGVDKVGKTTIKKFLQKALNYELYVQDRGEIGQEIYNEFFNRYPWHTRLDNDSTLYVLLYCSSQDELEFRTSFNEEHIDITTLLNQQDKYLEYWETHRTMSPNFIKLDIAQLGMTAIVNEIIGEINALNKCR